MSKLAHSNQETMDQIERDRLVEQGEALCEKCGATCYAEENEYGEFICDDCEQNRAEAAYERFCEDFHDGGSTQFKSLRDQQIDALKFK